MRSLSVGHRASPYRMGIDDRQEHHPPQAWAAMPSVIRGDGRGGGLSEALLVPQDPPCSRSLLDQARPVLHTGMHMEQPRQPWKHPLRMERQCDAHERNLSTVKADQREDVRDDKPQPRPYVTAKERCRPEHIHRTGCEFYVAQKLLALAKVEDNSGIRERCGQKNGEALCQSMGRECASSQRFFVRAPLRQ